MNIWLFLAFFVIWVFKDPYLNHRFDNKYVDVTFEFFSMEHSCIANFLRI